MSECVSKSVREVCEVSLGLGLGVQWPDEPARNPPTDEWMTGNAVVVPGDSELPDCIYGCVSWRQHIAAVMPGCRHGRRTAGAQ